MKIKSLKNQRADGKSLKAGNRYTISDAVGWQLVRMGRAVPVEEKKAGTEQEMNVTDGPMEAGDE